MMVFLYSQTFSKDIGTIFQRQQYMFLAFALLTCDIQDDLSQYGTIWVNLKHNLFSLASIVGNFEALPILVFGNGQNIFHDLADFVLI